MGLVTAVYFRVFQPIVAFRKETQEETARAVRAARIRMFPEWYLTLSYVAATIAAAAGLTFALVGALAAGLGVFAALLAVASAGAVFSLVRLGFLVYPRLVAASRAKRIEAEFPSVSILAYALVRGGMNALDVFRVIAQERDTFGEISVEFGLVVRETDWFGADVVTAIDRVASSTPSAALAGYLKGLVTILGSGAHPHDYLKRQAEAQVTDTEVRLQQEIDQAGLLAEVYVSGVLVLPLLLIVVLSVLSALQPGTASFIPFVVFGFIPLASATYLLLVEMLLPPEPLTAPRQASAPLADFGLDGVRPGDLILPPPRGDGAAAAEGWDPASRGLRRRLVLERMRKRFASNWDAFVARAIERPLDAIEISGTAAILLVVLGGLLVWGYGERGVDLILTGTNLILSAALIAAVPVSVFHEVRLRRARRIAASLPEMLGKLAGFNERGIGLVQSFQILGRTDDGPLASELRALDRDLAWNASLANALRRLRDRVSTIAMTKLIVLFTRTSAATGDLRGALEVAASDARTTENLRQRKQQSMVTYVVVIYLVFAVFLYVVYMVTDLFYATDGFAVLSATATAGSNPGPEPAAVRLLFFHAVLLQGIFCGFVAGKLGEGHLLSGIKHAIILGVLAWVVFFVGVL